MGAPKIGAVGPVKPDPRVNPDDPPPPELEALAVAAVLVDAAAGGAMTEVPPNPLANAENPEDDATD